MRAIQPIDFAATEKHLEDMRGLAFDAIKAQRYPLPRRES